MKNQSKHILFISDCSSQPEHVRTIMDIVEVSGFGITHINQIEEGAQEMGQKRYDLILLELSGDEQYWLQNIEVICRSADNLPVVVLSPKENFSLGLQAVRIGAQDFVCINQIDSNRIVQVLHFAITRKRIEQHYRFLATHDSLTGLQTRSLFSAQVNKAMSRADRNGQLVALFFIDLDNFKEINDHFGHASGDQTLKMVANHLMEGLRKSDMIFRFGGDEFILVIEGGADNNDIDRVAQKVTNFLEEPVIYNDRNLKIQASIGISIYPTDCKNIHSLVKYADYAMYCAKQADERYMFYSKSNCKNVQSLN
jgi:diguanylate cyclase (GGDEF)-like protein